MFLPVGLLSVFGQHMAHIGNTLRGFSTVRESQHRHTSKVCLAHLLACVLLCSWFLYLPYGLPTVVFYLWYHSYTSPILHFLYRSTSPTTYMLSLPDSPGDSRNLVKSSDLPVGRMNLPDFYHIEIRLKSTLMAENPNKTSPFSV